MNADFRGPLSDTDAPLLLKVGDVLMLVGDFNANAASRTLQATSAKAKLLVGVGAIDHPAKFA